MLARTRLNPFPVIVLRIVRSWSSCHGITSTHRPGCQGYERRIRRRAEASRPSLEGQVGTSPHSDSSDLCSLNTYSNTAQKQVVLKCAPETRLQREKEILQEFAGDGSIRQLIDCGKETPFLVLEHLESDALRSSSEARISRQEFRGKT